jgi:hypothetical protein
MTKQKKLSHSAQMRKPRLFRQSAWKSAKIPFAILMTVLMGLFCGLMGIWWTIYKEGL